MRGIDSNARFLLVKELIVKKYRILEFPEISILYLMLNEVNFIKIIFSVVSSFHSCQFEIASCS